jgi:lipoprotein-anchoring transpeptidase ErfK/SrfK
VPGHIGDLDLENEKRDRDREDAVAEGLQAVLLHAANNGTGYGLILRRTIAITAALVSAAAPAGAAAAPPTLSGVVLVRPATAHAAPRGDARAVGRVKTYTPLTLHNAVYPVVARHASADGADWVRIDLPWRPNGARGWIPVRVTRQVSLPWRIRVVLHRRHAYVYRNGKLVRSFRVVVGARGTPTPHGHFYITERVKIHTSWAHGLWALATSAHSNVFQEFEGGDGQIALHARGSLSGRLGSAASHGCIRLANGTAAWLARVAPRGTPLDVVR